MKQENLNEKNFFKTKPFFEVFVIPSITWVAISLLALIADVEDPVTLWDIIIVDIVIIYLWFLISLIITLIVWKVRKNKKQKFERVNSLTKEEIKEPKIEIEESEKVKEINYLTKREEKAVVKSEDSKKNSKKKKKDKLLYTCESIVDGYEMRQALKYFPELGKGIYISTIFGMTMFDLIIFALIAILFKNVMVATFIFIIFEIIHLVLCKLALGYYVEAYGNKQVKKGVLGKEIYTEFYDDYLTRTTENLTYKFHYTDISRIVETDTNIYLKDIKHNSIINIQKNRCSLELINFIRKKFSDIENHLGETSKFKGVKEYHHPNFIKAFMIILFIITLMSLFAGLFTIAIVDILFHRHGLDFPQNAFIFWAWLPIPILSIILGFKYTKAGFKCTKNIVGGFIMAFLLLIYGSFGFFPNDRRKDYNEIYTYSNIINVKLPNNGKLGIQTLPRYFDDDKFNYTVINAYYDNENVEDFVNEIKNSPTWILSTDINPELKTFIPSTLYSDDDAYYSIYNKTTSDYNTLPELEDKYAMKYDISDKKLEIHKFDYYYK